MEIWSLSKDFAREVYSMTKNMPQEETYGLTSQMRRSISIPSNIAEGCSRNSNKEFIRFLEIAIGSSFELETQLLLTGDLGILKSEIVADSEKKLNELQRKINALITSVKSFKD